MFLERASASSIISSGYSRASGIVAERVLGHTPSLVPELAPEHEAASVSDTGADCTRILVVRHWQIVLASVEQADRMVHCEHEKHAVAVRKSYTTQ
jgi:hypothetical protein